jgi:hypothetical protein
MYPWAPVHPPHAQAQRLQACWRANRKTTPHTRAGTTLPLRPGPSYRAAHPDTRGHNEPGRGDACVAPTFVPPHTRVGTTRCVAHPAQSGPVSPPAWPQLRAADRMPPAWRTTPARVATTTLPTTIPRPVSVHPTRVGTTRCVAHPAQSGPVSPPAWPQLRAADRMPPAWRTTPARVATTTLPTTIPRPVSVHPTRVGTTRCVAHPAQSGPVPPAAWGQPLAGLLRRRPYRSTPTRAGATGAVSTLLEQRAVHPYPRGHDGLGPPSSAG